jgi:serine/threonine protein phosphatase 1
MYTCITTSWETLPQNGTIGNRPVFAIGDIHGRKELFEILLTKVSQLGEGEDFDLVLLGDYIDRGPESLYCLTLTLQAQHITQAKNIYILPGNHELMMLDGLHKFDSLNTWLGNGGTSFITNLEEFIGQKIVTDTEIINALERAIPPYWRDYQFPNFHKSGNILFVHAGISPNSNYKFFLQKPPQNVRLQLKMDDHWAWIRRPFLTHTKPWDTQENITIVHGHTPVTQDIIRSPFILKHLTIFPNESHRICLDGGASHISQGFVGEFRDTQVRVHACAKRP